MFKIQFDKNNFFKSIFLILAFIVLAINGKFLSTEKTKINSGKDDIPHLAWIAHKLSYENSLIENLEHESFRTVESTDKKVRCNIITLKRKEFRRVDMVISFRGTETDTLLDTLAGVNIIPKKLDGLCKDCKVVRGFYNDYKSIEEEFIRVLTEELKLQTKLGRQVENMYFTGHSLGGSIAHIAVNDFLNRKAAKDLNDFYFKLVHTASLVTFGSPRVGSINFRDFFNDTDYLRDNLRIVYGDDVFPDLVAGRPWSFYRHTGDFAHFPENNYDEPQIFERTKVDQWKRPGGLFDKFKYQKKIAHHRVYSLLNPKGVENAILKLRSGREKISLEILVD